MNLAFAISKYEWIDKLHKIPFFGGLILFILSAFPSFIIIVISETLSPISDEIYFMSGALLNPFWNLILFRMGIKIFVLFVRADLFWFLMGGYFWVFENER